MAKPKCTLVLRAVGTDGEWFVVKRITNSTHWFPGQSINKHEVNRILEGRKVNLVIVED